MQMNGLKSTYSINVLPIMKEKKCLFIIVFALFSAVSYSQYYQDTTLSGGHARKWITLSTMAGGYTSSTILLNNAWYKDYPRSSFHLYDDWGEWENMDKMGHVFSSQFQSIYAYHLYRWSGVSEDKAIIWGGLTSLLFQSTIEVLDGFSTEWGFSLSDYGANLIGVSLFALQQHHWQEQRILMKVSGGRRSYPEIAINSNDGTQSIMLEERVNNLFGSSIPERFLKDYNAQTSWVSFNIRSLLNVEDMPSWINFAIGFGAENMFGGYENIWVDDEISYQITDTNLSRYNQYYLAPDIDLTRIPVKKKGWKTVLGILNIFKVPLPALELTSNGDFKFHYLKF